MADVAADQLLAAAVVGRGVDQVDAAVEDRVQQAARVLVRDLRTARSAPQLHGAIAKSGHVRAGTPEGSCHDRHISNAIRRIPGQVRQSHNPFRIQRNGDRPCGTAALPHDSPS